MISLFKGDASYILSPCHVFRRHILRVCACAAAMKTRRRRAADYCFACARHEVAEQRRRAAVIRRRRHSLSRAADADSAAAQPVRRRLFFTSPARRFQSYAQSLRRQVRSRRRAAVAGAPRHCHDAAPSEPRVDRWPRLLMITRFISASTPAPPSTTPSRLPPAALYAHDA